MALSGHQFFWAFADTFGTVTAKEGAVIEEELQQAEIRCAQWFCRKFSLSARTARDDELVYPASA